LTDFALDASVVMAWCFQDEAGPYADALLERLPASAGSTAVVPAIWPFEVANALMIAMRRGRISRSEIDAFVGLLATLQIEVEPPAPSRIFSAVLSLASECELSVYDASYVETALRRGIALATLDRKLLAAAKKLDIARA